MKKFFKQVVIWEIVGIVVVFLLGFLWHFLYPLFEEHPLVGLFAPVNESSWEHIKIFFYPWWIFALFEHYFIKFKVTNFIFSKMFGLIIFQLFTLSTIALVDNITGQHSLMWTMILYFIGISIGTYVSYYLMTNLTENKTLDTIGLIFLCIQLFVMFLFTVNPPRLDYFKDPITGTYGIYKYK